MLVYGDVAAVLRPVKHMKALFHLINVLSINRHPKSYGLLVVMRQPLLTIF